MPLITTLLIAAGSAGLAFISKGAKEVAKEQENEVYRMNRSIQNIIGESRNMLEAAGQKLNNLNNELINCKKDILAEELPSFITVFEKIHNIEEKKKILNSVNIMAEINKQKEEINAQEIPAKLRAEASPASIAAHTFLTPSVVSVGIILKEFVSFKKSSDKLEVLKAEKKKADIQKENALKKVAIMNDAAQKCLEAKIVLRRLAKMLDSQTKKLSETASSKSFNFKEFSQAEKEDTLICVNLAKAVAEIIEIPFVFENGEINLEAVASLKLAQEQLQKKENNNG